MVARLIDGKARAAALRARVAEVAHQLKREHGVVPGLATVLVGEDPASQVYVRSKHKAALDAGFRNFEHRPRAGISEAELLGLVRELNADPEVDGVLVQLPLPRQINARAIIDALDPAKDVDGFHARNVLASDCTVTTAHSKTRDLPAVARRADILVAAVGRAEMVKGSWIKPGATVIDVGINRVSGVDGKPKLVGDVAFAEAREVAGALTPVPGGIGPMTIACLLRNTVVAACRRRGLREPEL